MKDIKAKILSNEEIASRYFKMTLEAPFIAKGARPGQFVMVRCSGALDPLLRRPLGIHRVRGSLDFARDRQGSRLKGIEILYEVVGKGTELLSKRQRGEFIDILGPLGNGFELPSAVSGQLLAILVGGGIGVAPLVFLAEELARQKVKTIVLIGARTKKMILCEKDFKKIGAEVHVATDDGTSGYKGLVSNLFRRVLRNMEYPSTLLRAGGIETTVYGCGPQPMLQCITGICKKREIECQVSLEENMACGIGACLGCTVKIKAKKGFIYKLACKDGPIFKLDNLSLCGCQVQESNSERR